MKRGDLLTIALQGDLGKPRPALMVQSDLFVFHPSAVILPITSELRDTPLFRITIDPTERNGLVKRSQIMIDKPQAVSRDKLGPVFGSLADEQMIAVNRALALFLGFA